MVPDSHQCKSMPLCGCGTSDIALTVAQLLTHPHTPSNGSPTLTLHLMASPPSHSLLWLPTLHSILQLTHPPLPLSLSIVHSDLYLYMNPQR